MNSINFLFVVWAFLVLGGIARCKPPYPSEPRFSPRTLFFSTEGSDSAEGSNVDALDTNLARIAGAAARIAGANCADYRSGRGVSSLSRPASSSLASSPPSPLASSPLDRLVRFSGEIDSGNCNALLPRPGYSVVNGWGRSQLFVSFGDTTRSVVQRKAIFVLKHRKAKWKGSETWKENAWHI